MPQPTPYEAMQKAVDIVNGSLHPTNKIAAALTGAGPDGAHYNVAMTNYWPERIHACFGHETRIGNSSGTIHAETACLLTAPMTEGASLYITDPFCPNCAKNMAEAEIRTIYIDHKGFSKDFAARRNDAFETMSMRICVKAGIAVHEVNRREGKTTPILSIPEGFRAVEDRPILIEPVPHGLERQALDVAISQQKEQRRYAAAIARDHRGHTFAMTAFAHPAIGFTYGIDRAELEQASGKYSFTLEPVNRLLMNAARRGLKLLDGLVYASQAPTSREQVNLVGAGISSIRLGTSAKARDDDSLAALKMLGDAGILIPSPLRGEG